MYATVTLFDFSECVTTTTCSWCAKEGQQNYCTEGECPVAEEVEGGTSMLPFYQLSEYIIVQCHLRHDKMM